MNRRDLIKVTALAGISSLAFPKLSLSATSFKGKRISFKYKIELP